MVVIKFAVTVVAFSPMLGNLAFTGMLAVLAFLVIVLAVIPVTSSGRTIVTAAAFHLRFAGAGNASAYADDTLEEFPRGENLPGPLAPLCPIEVEDGRGGTQALIWNRQTGLLTAPLLVAPVGLTLADDADATTQVVGSWTYIGTGWRDDTEEALALATAARSREYDLWKAQRRTTRRGH